MDVKDSETRCFVALGANLNNPRKNIEAAIDALDTEPTRVEKRAPLYRSKPVGPPGQPDYMNTVVQIRTALHASDLLDRTQQIEQLLGRKPAVRWGPRVVDLDIILYGNDTISTGRLTVPHKELQNRRFVLQPLSDLDPDLVIPGLGCTVLELLAKLECPKSDVQRLE